MSRKTKGCKQMASDNSADKEAPQDEQEGPALADSSTDSLAKTFSAMAERSRAGLQRFRPTLAKLQEFVSKFHSIGVDQVGVELASFDKLREYNLMTRPGSDDQSLYAVLSIYDARFLVRVQDENTIVTYTENIAKPSNTIQYLDSDEFWYRTERSSGGTLKVNKNDRKFNVYNLGDETDVVSFMSAIAETTAALTAKEELRSYDAPAAGEGKILPKTFKGLKPKA